jgi:ABC-type dipeptide/oligopeptide/nickel transport system permease subunit
MRRLSWLGVTGLCLVLAAWLLAALAPWNPLSQVDPALAEQGPCAAFWLGTDHMGRDVASRLVFATRAFVGPGLLACAIASVLGLGGGALAGWFGGGPAVAIRFLSTVVASLPRFILVLLGAAIYGNGTWILGAIAGLAYSPTLAEAVFNRIDALKGSDFVLAARAHGIAEARILGYELLWVNCRRMVGRHALHLFGYLILLETTLSYIGGFGVQEPEPSWGNMLAFEFGVRGGNPLGVLAPALAIWLTILCCNVVGDALGEREHGR